MKRENITGERVSTGKTPERTISGVCVWCGMWVSRGRLGRGYGVKTSVIRIESVFK